MDGRVLAPIVIGVTGKRDLNGREEWVRASLRRLFERLDTDYRSSPKILLSAVAEGADTIAADEALKRENWEVIAVLPLPLDLYHEDYSEAGATRLEAILGNSRTKTVILKPLLDASTDGKPLEYGALHRTPGEPNPKRTDHYEQVGLFIADRATLLIAMMPGDEQPGRVGGTARIVHYRLNGPFDDTAKNILARSQELRAPNLLDDAHNGPVWLIDLANREVGQHFPARVLLPTERTGGSFGADEPADTSLELVDRLDRFNRRILTIPEERWQRDVVKRAGPDTGDATGMVRHLRLAMSAIQVHANKERKLAIGTLAAAFAVAAGAVELRESFASRSLLWWTLYFACGLLTIATYRIARERNWQRIAEDYRAVAEALRVQIAWWESGLTTPDHRVERMFLCGSADALALVRSATRHCVDAALLTRKAPARLPGSDAKWIDGQIKYFEARILHRRRSLLKVEIDTWILFLGALGATAYVLLNLASQDVRDALQQMWEFWWGHVRPGVVFLGTVMLLGLVSWRARRRQIGGSPRRSEPHRPTLARAWFAGAVFMGMAFAACLYDFAGLLNSIGFHVSLPGHPESKAPADQAGGAVQPPPGEPFISFPVALAAFFAVAPAALAGALRYRVEKLSYDAELPAYEDALRTYRRARSELTAIDAMPGEPTKKTELSEALLIALGKEALEESEGWLRAHRQRLIEPMI